MSARTWKTNCPKKKNGDLTPFFSITKFDLIQIASYRRRDLRALSIQAIAPKKARARIVIPQLPTVGIFTPVVEVLLVEVLVVVEVEVEVDVDVEVEVDDEVEVVVNIMIVVS